MVGSLRDSLWIDLRISRVIAVYVLAPFADVAAHVIQPQFVWLQLGYGLRTEGIVNPRHFR